MAAVILAILFWFRLPDVSRTYLLLLFPVQFLAALATRAALRLAFRRMRARGLNQRFVLVVGAGTARAGVRREAREPPRAGPGRDRLPRRRPGVPLPGRWRYRGRFADLEAILRSDVIDEVAVCLPVLALGSGGPDRGDRGGARQDRARPDGRPGPLVHVGPGRGPGRDAGLLPRLRAGPGAGPRGQAARRPGRGGAPARPPEPGAARGRASRSGARTAPRCSSATRGWVSTAARSAACKFRTMVPDAEARYAEVVVRVRPARLQADGRPAGHAARAPSSAGRASTSCPSSGTSCGAR